ncbi:MAG: alpha/beta fold hydrolase [Burkholderiales bacterium]|nr:alpha/beta fold hydrolase [Burkholderiales bacterium]
MGLGMQLTSWPEAFCHGLVARGLFVVRFDNRDAGLSGRAQLKPGCHPLWAVAASALHLPVRAPYTLDDMAHDTIGLMDRLGLLRAHVVGVSMGGMVAQVLAAQYPERVLSLTSIMSASGNRRVSRPTGAALKALLRRPADPDQVESVIDHLVQVFDVIGSPGYPTPLAERRAAVRKNVQRAYCPEGTTRQLLAIIASGDRRTRLRTIQAPTLVIHGDADPLVPLAAGKDVAANIPGAKLLTVPGMGHDLPTALLPQLVAAIADHTLSAKPTI